MNKSFLASFLSLLIFCTAGISLVHGQVGTGNQPTTGTGNPPPTTTHITLDNPFKATCGTGTCGILDLLTTLISAIVLPIGGVLAVLAFIWSGFMYVMAQGKPAEITKATNALKYAAIGTALLLGAYAISDVIKGTIGQLGGPKL